MGQKKTKKFATIYLQVKELQLYMNVLVIDSLQNGQQNLDSFLYIVDVILHHLGHGISLLVIVLDQCLQDRVVANLIKYQHRTHAYADLFVRFLYITSSFET